nr:hypothetical protein [Companilactobacillus formosensis]
MNNNDSNTTKTGLGFLSILTLIFVVAKIFNLIQWPWLLVFVPLWGPVLILIVFSLLAWLFFYLHGDL